MRVWGLWVLGCLFLPVLAESNCLPLYQAAKGAAPFRPTLFREQLDFYLPKFRVVPIPHQNGVEFEGAVPKGVTDEAIQAALAARLERESPSLGSAGSDHYVKYEKNGKAYTWTIKDDDTIRPPEGFRDVEITSPILRSPADIDSFVENLLSLRALGLRSDAERAGIHIHVGICDPPGCGQNPRRLLRFSGPPEEFLDEAQTRDLTAKLAALFKVFSQLEPLIDNLFAVPKERASFLRHIDRELLAKIDDGKVTLKDFMGTQWAVLNIGYGIRFTRYGTIEGRHMTSDLDPEKIRFAVRFWHSLVHAVLRQDKEFLDYVAATPPEKIDRDKILRLLSVFPPE